MVDELADLTGRLADLLTGPDGSVQVPGPGAAQTPPLPPPAFASVRCSHAATLQNTLAGGAALADLAATQTALLRESVQQMSELAEAGSAADTRGLAVQLRLIEAIAPTPIASAPADLPPPNLPPPNSPPANLKATEP